MALRSPHTYMHNYPNCPCTRNAPQPTCTITPILYVRETRPAYIHNYPNSLCTRNAPGLHAQLPQLFMYVKNARPTCTITPILYVREKRLHAREKNGGQNKKWNQAYSRAEPERTAHPPRRPLGLHGGGLYCVHTTTGHLNANIC